MEHTVSPARVMPLLPHPRDTQHQGVGLLRCAVPVPPLHRGLSGLRLTVRAPRRWCPLLTKKRVVAAFAFTEDGCKKNQHGHYLTDFREVNTAKLRTLRQDLPVKVKFVTQQRVF